MESYYNHRFDNGGDTHLPPGFRFHPTDEELITFYLLKKVLDSNFTARAIAEVDLNKCEPWELPGRAKMGEKEWYFFSLRDRKYPTGLRTNRATCAGYWKATGKDREIYSSKTCTLIGMKKTLVFYRGRAPRGEKSNWVMHEFRLEGKLANHFHSKPPKAEWVISRVFHKSCGGGAASSSGSAKPQKNRFNTSINLYTEASSPSSVSLPPLLDVTTTTTGASTTTDLDGCSYDSQTQPEHVSCFSTIIAAANHNYGNFNLATLPMAPSITDPFARFPRNNSTNAFPTLRPLHENLQLPFFSGSEASAVPQLPPFHGGGGGGAAAAMNWMVSLEEGRVEGGGGGDGRLAMGLTELDCMWTY